MKKKYLMLAILTFYINASAQDTANKLLLRLINAHHLGSSENKTISEIGQKKSMQLSKKIKNEYPAIYKSIEENFSDVFEPDFFDDRMNTFPEEYAERAIYSEPIMQAVLEKQKNKADTLTEIEKTVLERIKTEKEILVKINIQDLTKDTQALAANI